MANDNQYGQGKPGDNHPGRQRSGAQQDGQPPRSDGQQTRVIATPSDKQVHQQQPRKQQPRSAGTLVDRDVSKTPRDTGWRNNAHDDAADAHDDAEEQGLAHQGPAEDGAEPGARNKAEYRREVRD